MDANALFVTSPPMRQCQLLGASLRQKHQQCIRGLRRVSAPSRTVTTALTPQRPDPNFKKKKGRNKPLAQWQKHIDRDQNADNRGVGFWPMGSHERLAKERLVRDTFSEAYNRRILSDVDVRSTVDTILEGDGPLDNLIFTLRARYMEHMRSQNVYDKHPELTDVQRTLYNKTVKEIRRCDELYYADDPKPLVRDQDYDELVMHVLELERLFPELVTPDSPTQTVGHSAAKRSTELYEAIEESGEQIRAAEMQWRPKALAPPRIFKQLKHPIPMLSLSNAYNQRDLTSFGKKVEECGSRVAIEMKIDGVALSLHYKNRKLKKAVTRGNGRIGDDVTSNIRAGLLGRGVVSDLPDDAPDDFMVIRGEVFITPEDFQALLMEAETNLTNARNAAAGAIKHKDSREVRKRRVQFVAYECMRQDEETEEFSHVWKTQSETLAGLPTWGFGAMPKFTVVDSIDEAQLFAAQVEEQREELPFETDGVVLKVDDAEKRHALGHTAKSPRGAIALKFTARSVVTTVSSVKMQVSRTGAITPVAELVPTTIGGATIRRATLHNFDEVKRLGVGVGDEVVLERGGDVIPKITRVVSQGERRVPIVVPTACPCCGASVKVKTNDAGNTEVSCSESNVCAGQNLGRLIHFVSRDAMEITGMGTKTISKLLDSGLVVRLADFFKLTMEDLLTLDGIKEKTANSLYSAIRDAAGNRTLERLIIALGVPGIGRTSARALALKAETLDGLRDLTSPGNPALLSMPNVAEKSAERIAEYLRSTRIQTELRELNRVLVLSGVVEEPDDVDDDTKNVSVRGIQISGKQFAFTGTLNSMCRREAMKRIREAGGRVGVLTVKTDYLICGVDPGFKYQKAQRLRVPVLFEDDLVELFENKDPEEDEEKSEVVVNEQGSEEPIVETVQAEVVDDGGTKEVGDESEDEDVEESAELLTPEEKKMISDVGHDYEYKSLDKQKYGPHYNPKKQCLEYEMSLAELLHTDFKDFGSRKQKEPSKEFLEVDKEAVEAGRRAVAAMPKGFEKETKQVAKRKPKAKKNLAKGEFPWTDLNSFIEHMLDGVTEPDEKADVSLPTEEELDALLDQALSNPDNMELLLNIQKRHPVTEKDKRDADAKGDGDDFIF